MKFMDFVEEEFKGMSLTECFVYGFECGSEICGIASILSRSSIRTLGSDIARKPRETNLLDRYYDD